VNFNKKKEMIFRWITVVRAQHPTSSIYPAIFWFASRRFSIRLIWYCIWVIFFETPSPRGGKGGSERQQQQWDQLNQTHSLPSCIPHIAEKSKDQMWI
jgi:hypothetical protein